MADEPNLFVFGQAEFSPGPSPSSVKAKPLEAGPISDSDLAELKTLLADQLTEVARRVEELPEGARPGGWAVFEAVLRPGLVVRENIPLDLLHSLGMEVLGSRALRIVPRGLLAGQVGERLPQKTLALLVACSKMSLEGAPTAIAKLETGLFQQLSRLEAFSFVEPTDRLLKISSAEANCFVLALHILPGRADGFPLPDFKDFAASSGFEVVESHKCVSGNLVFLHVKGPMAKLQDLAAFMFLRQVGERLKPRSFKPKVESRPGTPVLGKPAGPGTVDGLVKGSGQASETVGRLDVSGGTAPMPAEPPDLGVVFFDGGLPKNHPLGGLVKEYIKADPGKADCEGGPEHGLATASAFLFGSLPKEGPFPAPPSVITVVRIIDESINSETDSDLAMSKALNCIVSVLATGKYRFANISLGPNLAVTDDQLNSWTVALDRVAAEYDVFVTVASGNNGIPDIKASPEALAQARIQVPSDGFNLFGAGASDKPAPDGRRARYSPFGPGRNPDRIKPDLLDFGGTDELPFMVLAPSDQVVMRVEEGTSFAAPSLLRKAVALLSMSKGELTNSAIKALLIHNAFRVEGASQLEVGWGLAREPSFIAAGLAGETRTIYQGQMPQTGFLIIRVPAPVGGWPGKTLVSATLYFGTMASAHDPLHYALTAIDARFVFDVGAWTDSSLPGGGGRLFFDLDGGAVDDGASPDDVARANVKSNAMVVDGKLLVDPGFVIWPLETIDSTIFPRGYALVITVSAAE